MRAEIEVKLLKKKKAMIQAAINRHEMIDEVMLDAQLARERKQLLEEASSSVDDTALPELSIAEGEELKTLFHDIVRDFHPQTHPKLSAEHCKLYQRAQELYRRMNLEGTKRIHKLLFRTAEQDAELLRFLILEADALNKDSRESPGQPFRRAYHLALQIFPYISLTEEETTIADEWENDNRLVETGFEELDAMRETFPYSVGELVDNPDRIQAYREELSHRLRAADMERERREEEIRRMLRVGFYG